MVHNEMLPPVYSAEDVEKEMPGTDAEISAGYAFGTLQIKREQVVLWQHGAGIVSLFAKKADQVMMVFENLTACAGNNCCRQKFLRSGLKCVIDIQELQRCHHPNWWYIAEKYVICL